MPRSRVFSRADWTRLFVVSGMFYLICFVCCLSGWCVITHREAQVTHSAFINCLRCVVTHRDTRAQVTPLPSPFICSTCFIWVVRLIRMVCRPTPRQTWAQGLCLHTLSVLSLLSLSPGHPRPLLSTLPSEIAVESQERLWKWSAKCREVSASNLGENT